MNAAKNLHRLMAVLVLLGINIAVLAACSCKSSPEVSDCGLIHEPEFGGVYITNTIDEFNDLGFAYGDSVTVSFSNGYVLEDLPYYNGYYTQNGEPLLVAYPGYDYIKAAINNGADLWTVAGLKDDSTATITLFKRGKYADTQSARNLHYEDDRSQYESDEMFANFRSISVGNLSENILFRSASPCDNQHNRAPYVDKLIANAGVGFIVDLADTDEKLQGYIAKEGFDSPYFLSLYKDKKIIPLAMNMNFDSVKLGGVVKEILIEMPLNLESPEFRGKVARGMTAILENDGPYLIHCTEGKDRTGFVCMLLEALCGANYSEIVDDYMITYYNYYEFTEKSDKAKYDIIVKDVLDPMIRSMVGDSTVDIKSADLSGYARSYLQRSGMKNDAINALIEKLTK